MPIKRYAALNAKARLVLAMGLLLTCASTYAVTDPAVVDPLAQPTAPVTAVDPLAASIDPMAPLVTDPLLSGATSLPTDSVPPLNSSTPVDVIPADPPVEIDPALVPPPAI